MPPTSAPSGAQRDRFLVILIGVVVGYLVGRMLEDRFGWPQARYFAMPIGGLLAGVIARFTMDRFRPNDEGGDRRRLR
jgi:hypothetical protein